MYELIQISEITYYIQSPAKIGIVKINDKDIYNEISKGDYISKLVEEEKKRVEQLKTKSKIKL